MDGHALPAGELDSSQHQYLGTGGRHLEHLLVRHDVELARLRNDAGVSGEDSFDVRVVRTGRAERCSEGDRGRVGPTPPERRHVHRVPREALEARDEHDPPSVERFRRPGTGVISRIFAFVCTGSVRMPACEPVNETAS